MICIYSYWCFVQKAAKELSLVLPKSTERCPVVLSCDNFAKNSVRMMRYAYAAYYNKPEKCGSSSFDMNVRREMFLVQSYMAEVQNSID